MIGIVSGSGIDLRPLLDEVEYSIPFHDVPGLMDGHVKGHASLFVRGYCDALPVILQSGRLHSYEGLSFDAVTRTVDVLYEMGVRRMIFTNAVGALDPALPLGALVAANEVRTWPYHRFALPETATPEIIPCNTDAQGVYYWMHGPCYETHAEIAALQRLGGHTVGMSTAPELLRCQQLGIAAGMISCVTNACGQTEAITHEEVLSVAQNSSARLCEILCNAIINDE